MGAGGCHGGEREELGAEHCAFLQSNLLIIMRSENNLPPYLHLIF